MIMGLIQVWPATFHPELVSCSLCLWTCNIHGWPYAHQYSSARLNHFWPAVVHEIRYSVTAKAGFCMFV